MSHAGAQTGLVPGPQYDTGHSGPGQGFAMAPRTTLEATHRPHRPETVDEPSRLSARSRVEVRIVAGDPEAARQVADALRLLFAGAEQRSYPEGPSGTGTRLHLTLDTSHTGGPLRSWLDTSRPPADQSHPDETV